VSFNTPELGSHKSFNAHRAHTFFVDESSGSIIIASIISIGSKNLDMQKTQKTKKDMILIHTK
jgi:hypothetical protein